MKSLIKMCVCAALATLSLAAFCETRTMDHTDKRSLKDPEGGWGWCLRQGATMIQTDYPVECGAWLRKVGRHEGF